MSRHTRQLLGKEVVVGWDPPLQTFFGQVYDPDDDEDAGPFVWVGTLDRLPTVEDLGDALGVYGEMLDPELERTLVQDKDANR